MELLRKLLYPFSPLYAAGAWLRNKAYDLGWFPSKSFPVAILCVGNLSVGGTGKTPMVEWLLTYFKSQRHPAVLSRGYGRKTKGFQWVHPGASVYQTGDEPLQMAQKFPGVDFAVDADRVRGIRRLLSERNPDLIILDDAFQHRRVRPDLSILLTAWGDLYTDQTYLPAGDLRDHRSQARRARLVVVTKSPENLGGAVRQGIRDRLGLESEQGLVFSSLRYDAVRDCDGNEVGEDRLRAASLTLVTGIANPGPLKDYLDDLGLRYTHLEFPDHHSFNAKEAARIRSCDRVLTTAKDATRLVEFLDDFWVVGVSHHFGAEDRKILEGVLRELP